MKQHRLSLSPENSPMNFSANLPPSRKYVESSYSIGMYMFYMYVCVCGLNVFMHNACMWYTKYACFPLDIWRYRRIPEYTVPLFCCCCCLLCCCSDIGCTCLDFPCHATQHMQPGQIHCPLPSQRGSEEHLTNGKLFLLFLVFSLSKVFQIARNKRLSILI